MKTIDEVIIGIKEQMGLGDPILIDALYYLREYRNFMNVRLDIPENYKIVDLNALPVIKSEQKKGKWKLLTSSIYECSECKSQFYEHKVMNFCPECGADMRKEWWI